MYFIGYDIGSSFIKAALVNGETGALVATVKYPEQEMPISAAHPGWAEQDPSKWWQHVIECTQDLLQSSGVPGSEIKAIGLAYQMHGLVLIDKQQRVLRPSIIWCDSRAVQIGQTAWESLGKENCLQHLLNSPGNFTASKLQWVHQHEPRIMDQVHKIMLPGDYIALCMTGEATTTVSGLSEGMFWDFKQEDIAYFLLDYYGIHPGVLADQVPTFGRQGVLHRQAAEALGLPAGTPVTYRAGDQPNNALALNVLEPGEVAATGGTSGVVYGVSSEPVYDLKSRVNGFAHVNHHARQPRIGVLLCINGAGIQYSWLRRVTGNNLVAYDELEARAQQIPPGAAGICVLPFGNGAERMFGDLVIGAHWHNLDYNRHESTHLLRAGLEGVAFAMVYGMDILRGIGIPTEVIRVGNDNLFRSEIFSTTISPLTGATIELYETTGAIGAARGAGFGLGHYPSLKQAFSDQRPVKIVEPDYTTAAYLEAYGRWLTLLEKYI